MVGNNRLINRKSKIVFPVLTCATLPKSCRSCLRREQACRNLTEDLLVVSGYRPLHMNTSALYACFLHQPLELTLKKDFQLLRSQDGNGNSRGLAGIGLDPDAVWGFGLLRFWSHVTHLFSGATKAAGKNVSILAYPAVPRAIRWVGSLLCLSNLFFVEGQVAMNLRAPRFSEPLLRLSMRPHVDFIVARTFLVIS